MEIGNQMQNHKIETISKGGGGGGGGKNDVFKIFFYFPYV